MHQSIVFAVCDTRDEPAGDGGGPVSLFGGDGQGRAVGERGPCDILPLVGAANLQLDAQRAGLPAQALGEYHSRPNSKRKAEVG